MEFLPSPPPLTPPQVEEDWLDWIRLLRSRRVGISTFYRLMGVHGSASEALAALPAIAAEAGVTDYAACPRDVAEDEWRRAAMAGARPIAFGSPDYPLDLAEIPDPPPILWARGDTGRLAQPIVAVVGARNASSLGLRMAKSLADGLGKDGFAVVSGLARGIDTAAHRGALPHGTVAVFAGGVDVVYPAENAVLAQEIEERGLILSEQPMGTRPVARHFPRRNRIVSGLARATVVVEAAAKSGSLLTAREAADQGREVMAVPGHPFDARAAGCNMLIRDGATLVRGARDVVEALHLAAGPEAGPGIDADTAAGAAAVSPGRPAMTEVPAAGAERRGARETQALHALILDRLSPVPTPEDALVDDLGAPASEVAAGLVDLELDGRIERAPGGLLIRPQ